MPNRYPEWRNFPFAPNNYYGYFFLHTLPLTVAFKRYFINSALNSLLFRSRQSFVRLLRMTLTSKRLAADVVMTSKTPWRHKRESSHTSWSETTFPCTDPTRGNSCRVCKKNMFTSAVETDPTQGHKDFVSQLFYRSLDAINLRKQFIKLRMT